MKKSIKKFKKIQGLLETKRAEWSEINKSLYYAKPISGSYGEQKRKFDLNEIEQELKDLLSLEFAAMESLQISLELAKADNQHQQREITLKNIINSKINRNELN